MSNTKDEPGPFDALQKARGDEPIFTLLGRDPAAPSAITEWCRVRRNNALRDFTPGSPELVEELRQCADAEAIAFQMDDYRKGVTVAEEQVAPARVAHSGLMGETQEQRDQALALAQTVEHLRNAIYHMAEADALMDKLDFDASWRFEIAVSIGSIRAVDKHIAPKRGGVQQALDLPEPVAPTLACEHDWQKTDNWLIDRCSKCGEERA